VENNSLSREIHVGCITQLRRSDPKTHSPALPAKNGFASPTPPQERSAAHAPALCTQQINAPIRRY